MPKGLKRWSKVSVRCRNGEDGKAEAKMGEVFSKRYGEETGWKEEKWGQRWD